MFSGTILKLIADLPLFVKQKQVHYFRLDKLKNKTYPLLICSFKIGIFMMAANLNLEVKII